MERSYEKIKHTYDADFGSSGSILHTNHDFHNPEDEIKLNIGIIMGTQLNLIISSLEHSKTTDEIINLQESSQELRNPFEKLMSHLNII